MNDRFVIVGSGKSAYGFTPPENVTVIAVNQDIPHYEIISVLDCRNVLARFKG